jgi:signal transduction histidine kinase
VDFQYGNTPWSFGETLDAVLYRLVQEGLTNSFRHGKATKIRIVFWSHEGELRITIWDNGTGSYSSDEGLGLRGMRERVEALGGSIDHHNTVDGYELSAVIPLGGEGAEEAHE